MKLSPKHCRALKLLGSALYAQGDFENACSALQSALELNPNYADAYCDLGCALCALGRVEPAKEAFGNAARLDSNHVEVSCERMLLVAVCCSHVDAFVIGGLLNQAPSPIIGVERQRAHIQLRRNPRATPNSIPTCDSDKHVLCTGCCRPCSIWETSIDRVVSTGQRYRAMMLSWLLTASTGAVC